MKRYSIRPKQSKTSTPTHPGSEPTLNFSIVSNVGINRSPSRCINDKSMLKRSERNKDVIQKDELDYEYNVYLLALSTTKMQEQALAELTAKNEDKKMALLTEIDRKHTYLGKLIHCEEEIKSLSKESAGLRMHKQIFVPLMDEMSEKMKHLEMLKNSIQVGVPVRGFLTNSNTSELKDVLSKLKETHDRRLPLDNERCSAIAEALDNIEKTVSRISELQNRCKTDCAELQGSALEENSLKMMKLCFSKKGHQ